MNDKQRRRFERAARISANGAVNAADFHASSKGGEGFVRLSTHIATVESLDVAKEANRGAKQQGSQGRRDLRAVLRSQLAAICNTAEVIGIDHAEVRGLFPRAGSNRSDQTLLALARSYAAAALPLKALFIEYDMPADFIERLSADIDELEQHINRQTESAGASVATNAAIEEALNRADEEIERLNAIVHNKYRDDPVKLAAWESARRLERPTRTKRESAAGNKDGVKGSKDGSDKG
jgi:hypothetical protein